MAEESSNSTPFSELKTLIARDFSLDLPDGMDEQALFDMVANEVAYMIEHQIEQLMSMLYRLDVLEPHINHALSPLCSDPANIALAKLILERQAQRIKTKKEYQVNKDLDLGDLSWE